MARAWDWLGLPPVRVPAIQFTCQSTIIWMLFLAVRRTKELDGGAPKSQPRTSRRLVLGCDFGPPSSDTKAMAMPPSRSTLVETSLTTRGSAALGIRFYSVTRSYPKLFRRHGHGRREALISPITHADGGMAMVLALTRMANGGMAHGRRGPGLRDQILLQCHLYFQCHFSSFSSSSSAGLRVSLYNFRPPFPTAVARQGTPGAAEDPSPPTVKASRL